MRLLSFRYDGRDRVGVRVGDEVVDVAEVAPDLPSSVLGVLQGGSEALAAIQAAVGRAKASAVRPVDQIEYLLPITRPPTFIGIGMNYAVHLEDFGVMKMPDFPGMYLRSLNSLTPHNGPIIRPKLSEQLDYECELIFVIGRRAHHVSDEDAHDYIAGYSCFNDGSLRDYNRLENAVTAGKIFDSTGGFGPELVTADELPTCAAGLWIQTRRNGRVVQQDNTKNMWWPVARVLSMLSAITTLEPGDVITTGTCGGCVGAEPEPDWLQEGDVVEVEIEGIGVLRNHVINEK